MGLERGPRVNEDLHFPARVISIQSLIFIFFPFRFFYLFIFFSQGEIHSSKGNYSV